MAGSLAPFPYLVLLEYPVDPEHMVEHFVEQHQRNIEFFLVEHLEASLHIVSQLFLLHWEIVLGQPVAVQDGTGEGSLGGGGGGTEEERVGIKWSSKVGGHQW